MPKKDTDMQCYFIEGLNCNDDCMNCDVITHYIGFEPQNKTDIEIAIQKKMSDNLKKSVFGA